MAKTKKMFGPITVPAAKIKKPKAIKPGNIKIRKGGKKMVKVV